MSVLHVNDFPVLLSKTVDQERGRGGQMSLSLLMPGGDHKHQETTACCDTLANKWITVWVRGHLPSFRSLSLVSFTESFFTYYLFSPFCPSILLPFFLHCLSPVFFILHLYHFLCLFPLFFLSFLFIFSVFISLSISFLVYLSLFYIFSSYLVFFGLLPSLSPVSLCTL